MYGIADKYGIHGLKSISTQKMKAALQHKAWNPDSQQCYSDNMIQEFAAAVHAIWSLTPDSDKGLRAPLLKYALKNKNMLLEAEGFIVVIQQSPHFACDLLAQTPNPKAAKSLAVPKTKSILKRKDDLLIVE